MGERGVTERLEGVFEREGVSSALAIDSLTIDAVIVAEAGPSSPLPLPPSPFPVRWEPMEIRRPEQNVLALIIAQTLIELGSNGIALELWPILDNRIPLWRLALLHNGLQLVKRDDILE